MMKIYCTADTNGYRLQTNESINGKRQEKGALSEGESVRLAKIWNKLYVTETMMKWLNQRIFALKLMPLSRKLYLAQDLQDSILKLQQRSDRHLYLLIVNNQHVISEIAPAEGSGHYDHYRRRVSTIVEFCILNSKADDHAD